ncbi:MAG: hypothetical protein OEM38_10505 [Gammaproteobacteria bacterium]|nr:hypothetical protein [Gammaproteobacteria bacterium]
MDTLITLTADNKEELNRLIDEKLKERYLLKGGIQNGDMGNVVQVMVFPNNIDSELTLSGAFKLVIMVLVYIGILYFVL